MTEADPDVYLLVAPADEAGRLDGEVATRMSVLPPEAVAQIRAEMAES